MLITISSQQVKCILNHLRIDMMLGSSILMQGTRTMNYTSGQRCRSRLVRSETRTQGYARAWNTSDQWKRYRQPHVSWPSTDAIAVTCRGENVYFQSTFTPHGKNFTRRRRGEHRASRLRLFMRFRNPVPCGWESTNRKHESCALNTIRHAPAERPSKP